MEFFSNMEFFVKLSKNFYTAASNASYFLSASLKKSASMVKTRTCRNVQGNVKLKQISGSATTFNKLSLKWHTYNAADEKITRLYNLSFAPQ